VTGTIGIEHISRSGYEWLRATAIDPDHGSYLLDVHGIQFPNKHIVLMVFLGKHDDTGKQVDLVDSASRNLDAPIIRLREDDITEDLVIRMVDHFRAHPDSHVATMEVMRRGDTAA
jgi:hypothetical protein